MNAPLTAEQIKRAGELVQELERIEGQLQAIFGSGNSHRVAAASQPSVPRQKRRMSAAARARIASAQRARWAKTRENAPARPERGKKKRTMSPQARAKISAAQKRRWAKQRKGK